MARRRSRGRPPEGTPAAKLEPAWRRIDLHIHTPGSSDYQEPRASYLDILQKAEARGLDMIAFTDHNSVAGYAAMQREIAYLELLEAGGRLHPDEARRLHDYRRLRERVLVLPGFEFTATFGFHILAIFPPETTVRKLEHLLLELNVPEEKLDHGTSEVGATTDVLRAYEVIADAGGLVIGAHVNSTHGIAMIGLGFGGQTKIAYTQDRNLHALEVTDLENTSRRATARFFNGSKPEYPRRMHCIQGSDAHRVTRDPQSPEKNLGVGDRCTEVLLPEVSFAALKDLFASTDFGRERPYRPSNDPFDPLSAAREEGNTIVQAFHETPGVPRAPVKGLLKDLVAFANTNGGVLYVGASASPGGPIRGVENAAEVAQQIRAEAARLVVPPLQPDVETLAIDGKTVLVVTVSRGTETPYALEPGYIYVRQEGETALALRDEIVQLVRASLEPAAMADLSSPLAQMPQPLAAWNGATPPPASSPRAGGPPAELLARPSGPGVASPAQRPQQPPRPAPQPQQANRQASEQVAVQQATDAERDRQQERTPVPRTGVEIIASTERDGVIYHTVRDLRNRRVVRNVTRESARRLWRYAILQAEEHTVRPEDVRWDERDGRFGFWKGYRQPEGMCRYNLVYREQGATGAGNGNGGAGERLRVFYGVTEDGMDERWRNVLPPESALTEVYYDEPTVAAAPPPSAPTVADAEWVAQPAAVATAATSAAAEAGFAPAPAPPPASEVSATPANEPPSGEAAPAPKPKRRRAPRRKAPAGDESTPVAEAAPAMTGAGAGDGDGATSAPTAVAPVALPEAAGTPAVAPGAVAEAAETAAEEPAPAVKRPTRRRRTARPPAAPDSPDGGGGTDSPPVEAGAK